MSNAEFGTWEEAVVWLKKQAPSQSLVQACFYDDPLLAAANRYYTSSEWIAVRSLLRESSGKALDIGAGRGISAYALAKDGWRVTALEPDPSDVVGTGAIRKLAGESQLEIEVVQEWGEQLSWKDGSFDLVYCRQVLHHRDLNQLCSEIARVLRPGGFFLATREHVLSRTEDMQTFLQNHPLHRLYGGECAYLLPEYLSAIEEAGLRMCLILNPFASDINLYPETLHSMKRRVSRKLKWPWPLLIPSGALRVLGALSKTPGRLYSFFASKPG